jgi:hypothetical protein
MGDPEEHTKAEEPVVEAPKEAEAPPKEAEAEPVPPKGTEDQPEVA